MRILMTSWAWPSHYLPMVPLGWALRAAGHEVRVVSQPALAKTITDSGQVAVPAGPDLDHDEVHGRTMRDLRLTSVPHAPVAGQSMGGWTPDARDRVRRVFSVFHAYSEAMLDDLYSFALDWRPDLIVYDPTTFAAPVVAAALGVPTVRHIHGVDVTYQARDVVAELVAPLAARLGVSDVDVTGTATVDPCPPSMQIPGDVRRIFNRYVPYNGPAVLPDWLRDPPKKPRVCLTWGTSTTRIAGFKLFVPPVVIAAAQDLDFELVVTLTGPEADTLVDQWPQLRIVKALPLHLILPHCDAVVHQGGNGTILSGAYYGLPQLVLPQIPDQTFHTRQFVTTGAGIGLLPAEVNEDSVRQALISLPRYAPAAQRLAEEIHGTPTPADIVPELLALARVPALA